MCYEEKRQCLYIFYYTHALVDRKLRRETIFREMSSGSDARVEHDWLLTTYAATVIMRIH